MSMAFDTLNVCWRELKRFIRQPARVIMSIIQPIIWLSLMGNMFQMVGKLPGFPTSSYLDYMAPGIVIMTTLFGGVFGGLSVVWDRRFGFLSKMLAAPISRSSIPVGKMLASTIQSGLQASIILSVSLLMGVRCSTGVLGVIAIVLIAMLLCLALSGLSLALGAMIKTHETLMVIMNFLTLPLVFTSSALFPLEFMPSWLAAIAKWNPLTHAINPIRTLMTTGWTWTIILPDVAAVTAFALAIISIATLLFRRSIT